MKIVSIDWKKIKGLLGDKIRARGCLSNKEIVPASVSDIISKVQKEGDKALFHYTELFDGVKSNSIKVNTRIDSPIETSIKDAINEAYKRIKNFHMLQIPEKIESNSDGIKAWKEWRPIENVGLYVPGGTAPLISTLLMLAIPAKLAGCKNIVLVTPPNKNGEIAPEILYAADLCGIENMYSVGGAQAIAALAYGTKSIPKVDKIFGPGNKYVTEAKIQVAQDPWGAAIDMPAGPSEIIIITDENGNPDLIASDLLAQLEHDENANAMCITTSSELAEKINLAVKDQLKTLKRKTIISKALEHSSITVIKDLNDAFDISNSYAPEHLIIHMKDAENYTKFIKNAGSVFIGEWSAEALGDYASGPNHVLPTYGYAKSYSGLGVESFMKAITFQKVTEYGLLKLADTVETLANFEGLDAHKNSISIRKSLIEKKLQRL